MRAAFIPRRQEEQVGEPGRRSDWEESGRFLGFRFTSSPKSWRPHLSRDPQFLLPAVLFAQLAAEL